jgi:hypothetical protein
VGFDPAIEFEGLKKWGGLCRKGCARGHKLMGGLRDMDSDLKAAMRIGLNRGRGRGKRKACMLTWVKRIGWSVLIGRENARRKYMLAAVTLFQITSSKWIFTHPEQR